MFFRKDILFRRARSFSTFSFAQGNSIRVSNSFPSRLSIPLPSGEKVEFPLEKSTAVGELASAIKKEHPELRDIKFLQNGEPIPEDQSLGDTMRARFDVFFNNKRYTVFPDFQNMLVLRNNKELDAVFKGQSLPIFRRTVLSMYLDNVFDLLREKEGSDSRGEYASPDKLVKVLEKAIAQYKQDADDEVFKLLDEELKRCEAELAELEEKKEKLDSLSAAFAKRVVFFGLTMAMGQLVGFGTLIYGVYSWDVMEPITYMTGAFYACVGMGFFLRYRNDFEWGNVYDIFREKRFKKLCKARGLDTERLEFLDDYVKRLKDAQHFLTK